MNPIIKTENLSKAFFTKENKKGIHVLNKLNISVEKGEILCILGPSGCGKTTLLNIIAGLDKQTSGNFNVNTKKIGYMFQTPLLLPWRTVIKNITLGLEIQGNNINSAIKRARSLLLNYGLLEFQNSYPYILSGGMKQRVALIRTIITEPEILLLDEPFASLDYEKKLSLEYDIYHIAKKKKITLSLVTHDIEEAIALADKIIVLSKRPATIISSFNVDMKNKNPIERREDKDFRIYFKKIWEKMQYEKRI